MKILNQQQWKGVNFWPKIYPRNAPRKLLRTRTSPKQIFHRVAHLLTTTHPEPPLQMYNVCKPIIPVSRYTEHQFCSRMRPLRASTLHRLHCRSSITPALSTSSASYIHLLDVQEYTIEFKCKGQNIITETEHMLTSTLYNIAAKAQLYRVSNIVLRSTIEQNKIYVQRDECQSGWR